MGGNNIKGTWVPGIGVRNAQLVFRVSKDLDQCNSDQGQQEVWVSCGVVSRIVSSFLNTWDEGTGQAAWLLSYLRLSQNALY